MTGREEYKERYRKMTEKKLDENKDIKYLDDFYYYIAKKEPTTVYNYINYVIGFLRDNHICDPSKITFSSYNKYTAKLIKETPSYQISVYSALKKFSTFLAANRITEDYMKDVERPKNRERQETIIKREKSVLTKDEVHMMLDNILNKDMNEIWKQRDYALILLFVSSGIRSSALYKLDVSDIDFENGIMIVTEKRDNVREIILPTKAIQELRKWINIRNELNPCTSALFISNQRKRMSSKSIARIVNKYGSVNGKNGHPHILRSTYGTITYEESGGDLYLTQTNMGHSNPKTTELYIRGKDTDIKKRAAQIVDSYI